MHLFAPPRFNPHGRTFRDIRILKRRLSFSKLLYSFGSILLALFFWHPWQDSNPHNYFWVKNLELCIVLLYALHMKTDTYSTEVILPVATATGNTTDERNKKSIKKKTKQETEDGQEKKPRNKRQQKDKICKGYKFLIKPSLEQQVLLRQWMGCTRWIWNTTLYKQNEQYENDKSYLKTSTVSKDVTRLKKENDYNWLAKAPATVLNMSFQHLNKSWSAFFDGVSGKRSDQPGQPKFKQKDNTSVSFQVDPRHKNPIDIANKRIHITGLGYIPIKLTEEVFGEFSYITISKEGKSWLASIGMINVEPEQAQRVNKKENRSKGKTIFPDNVTDTFLNPNKEGLVAIDLSVTHSAFWTDNGSTAYSLLEQQQMDQAKKKEARRQKYQRIESRKLEAKYIEHGIKREESGAWPKNANKQLSTILNRKKNAAKEKLALQGLPEKHHQERLFEIEQLFAMKSQRLLDVSEKVNQCYKKERYFREDIIHKFTTSLVLNHHTIVLETLDLQEMAQDQKSNTGFRKSMHQACMGEIVKQLKYKCAWYNRTLIFVDKWFPSSKRCSKCHTTNHELKRSDKEWTCAKESCQTHNKRDDNATFNLWQEGWRLLELSFQQNNAEMLAAGSVVRGSQGVIYESDKKKDRKSKKSEKKITPERLSATPTEKSAGNSSIKNKFLKYKN